MAVTCVDVDFLQRVRVKRGAVGLNHGDRVAGREAIVVDAATGEDIRQELGSWSFLRFEMPDGTVLFFDWVRHVDLVIL
jgi:hypothetical protein